MGNIYIYKGVRKYYIETNNEKSIYIYIEHKQSLSVSVKQPSGLGSHKTYVRPFCILYKFI